MRNTITPDEIEHYDTGITAKHLRSGMHILADDEPVTVATVIADDERRQVVAEVEAVDGHQRRRVLYLPYDEVVDVGVVRQYGVAVPGRPTQPIHPIHGAGDSIRWVRVYRARHGGRIVTRDVIPHAPTRKGDYTVVTEWAETEDS